MLAVPSGMRLFECEKERENGLLLYDFHVVVELSFLGIIRIFGNFIPFLCFLRFASSSVYVFIYVHEFDSGGYASGKEKGYVVRKCFGLSFAFAYFERYWILNLKLITYVNDLNCMISASFFETVGLVRWFELLKLSFVHSHSFCFAPHQAVVITSVRSGRALLSRA